MNGEALNAKRLYHRKKSKQWRDSNREKYNEYCKKWRDSNPEKVRAAQERFFTKKAEEYKNNEIR